MDKKILDQFEAKCVQEEPPACQSMCPLHLDARSFINLMAQEKYDNARKLLDKFMPLSSLSAYLCDGPCREHCRRIEIDEAINLPLLERLCVMKSRPARLMPLPPGSKKVLAFGAGLSSLTLAWELARKGISLSIIHTGEAGGSLLSLPAQHLPKEALPEALAQLKQLRVKFEQVEKFSTDILTKAMESNLAVFLGFDDKTLSAEDLGLSKEKILTNEISLSTSFDNVFAYNSTNPDDFISSLAAGKRAAGSITRLGQGVSPSSAREAEAVFKTKLYTNLSGVEAAWPQKAADPFAPSKEEGKKEAERCIQCQCLECVKHCVYMRHYESFPKQMGREIYNNISTAFGIRQSNTMVLTCAECGLCGVICPQGADMARFIPLARREMVEVKHMPVSAHEFALEDLLFSNSKDISFWRHEAGQKKNKWLFFPGCQLPASMPAETLKMYEKLTTHLSGGVGFMLACCGAPARWSGRPKLTAEMVENFTKSWKEAGKPKIILACPSCSLFFKNELAEIECESLWNILPDLSITDFSKKLDIVSLHDPCAARYDKKTLASARTFLKNIGQTFEEMPTCGLKSKCCGYGGLASSANPLVGDKFIDERINESSLPILSYCIMCRDRFRKKGKASLHFLDLIFSTGDGQQASMRPAPDISDRQETRAAFAKKILETIWGEKPIEGEAMNNKIKVQIKPELKELMDKRRILRSDIIKLLEETQKHGAQFVNQDTGRKLSSYRPKQVTFWVEFTENNDGSFQIHDAYCHRMVVNGVPGEGAETAANLEGFDPMGGRR